MKYLLILCLGLIAGFLIGRVNQTEKAIDPSVPVKTTISNAQPMPSVQINIEDRSCSKDSDCEIVSTQCSCSCGEGVNKLHAEKYREQLSKLCATYDGKMCKVLCEATLKCQDKVCVY